MNYPIGSIADLATIEMGQSPKGETVRRSPTGLPLLNGPTEFGQQHPVPAQWTDAGVRFARPGDILFCVRGSTTGRMNRADQDYAIGRGIAALRARDAVDSRIVKYALDASLSDLLAGVSGSVFPNLSREQILQHRVPVPPRAEQQAIAEVLGALDDKIAANTALAATAWAFMETEFRAVRADPECTRTRLGAIASLEYGKALPASVRESGEVSVVGSGGVSGVHSKALIDRSGVVVGRKGSAGAVHWVSGPHFPIDTTFYVRGTDDAVSQPFLYFLLRTLRLDEMNNDSAVPGLNRSEALALPIWRPTPARLASFTAQAEGQIALVEGIDRENRALAATRDALLPQLMSGKLRVRDAEAAASEAGA